MPSKNNNVNLIFILGGGLIKNKNNKWRTRDYNEGSGGERMRVLAGYYLYNHIGDSLIVVSGGKGKRLHEPTTVTISSVIKNELTELGIPKKKITEDNKSVSTFEQLKYLKNFTTKNKYGEMVVISNKYHLPRINTMIAYIPELKFLTNKIKIISAESIILKYAGHKWKSIIEKAYKKDGMKKRIKMEKVGIRDIKNGTYKYS